MSEPQVVGHQVVEAGWRVLDPDGNVVDSGPGMVLIAVGDGGGGDDGDTPDPETDETEEN